MRDNTDGIVNPSGCPGQLLVGKLQVIFHAADEGHARRVYAAVAAVAEELGGAPLEATVGACRVMPTADEVYVRPPLMYEMHTTLENDG